MNKYQKKIEEFFNVRERMELMRMNARSEELLVADVFIFGYRPGENTPEGSKSKFHIMLEANNQLTLYRAWTNECYGNITFDNAKRLIKNTYHT